MESKSRNFLGAIIAVSAIVIMVIKYISNGITDSYIIPIILIFLSVVIFTNKTKKQKPQKEISKKQKTIILSIVSVALISGVITFFTTLF